LTLSIVLFVIPNLVNPRFLSPKFIIESWLKIQWVDCIFWWWHNLPKYILSQSILFFFFVVFNLWILDFYYHNVSPWAYDKILWIVPMRRFENLRFIWIKILSSIQITLHLHLSWGFLESGNLEARLELTSLVCVFGKW
jgi:hypothetical protein